MSDWSKQDRAWMLGLYGTAIGAGTLFLPINAGLNGLIPLLFLTLLALPMTHFSHRALCRLVLSGSAHQANLTHVVDEHFGLRAGRLLTILYFVSIYPIVLIYSVAITNTVESFVIHQTPFHAPPRGLIALGLLLGLMAIARVGHHAIIRAMGVLVYPFVLSLMTLALYLVPHWHGAIFSSSAMVTTVSNSHHPLLMSLWVGIPVIVFSFNHSPMISSFAVKQRHVYGGDADKKCRQILKYSHWMMMGTVFFFVFSCILSLSQADLVAAKSQNISILSYLANHFDNPFISYAAPLIAFIAIAKSFLGHYIGASEGLHGLLVKTRSTKQASDKVLHLVIDGFFLVSCWLIATLNPSILGMIEKLIGPIIAVLLFLLPMYAIHRIPVLRHYQSWISDGFVVATGFVALSAIVYGLFSA